MARKNVALDLANTMDYAKFKKLDFKEQKRITSILTSAVNKRIRRLGETEIGKLSPTYQAYENRLDKNKEGFRDGFYSIRGFKTTSKLYNRFESLANTLKASTSVTEWKKLRNKTLSALNLDGITPDDEKAFWSMYRKFQEDSKRYKKYRKEISDKILYYIARNFEGKGYDYTKSSRDKIMKYVRDEYEKDKQAKTRKDRERSTSVFVSEGDESEQSLF